MPIKNAQDLRHHALKVAQDSTSDPTPSELLQYLQSLLAAVQQCRHITCPSYAEIGTLLSEALVITPLDYDASWNDTPTLLSEANSAEYYQEIRSVNYTERMLQRQIWELHHMINDGSLEQPDRYFGITSALGSRWYNFTLESYLECGTVFLDNYEVEDEEFLQSDGWLTISFIFGDGQSYE
jgi:hypothetical protein